MPGPKIYCACGSKKQQKEGGVTYLRPCFWFQVNNGCHAPVGTGRFGQLHPLCFLALAFRGLLQHAPSQALFEVKFREFLHRFVEEYPTKRAFLDLIPSLAATPVTKPIPVQFNPVEYLSGGTLPPVYPDSIMEVILSALQEIIPDATLADINQNDFSGSYLSFYMTANSNCSPCNTQFVDEMRGVEGHVRQETRDAGLAHNANSQNKGRCPSTSIGRQNISSRKHARTLRCRREIALMLARTFAASNLPFDRSKLLEKDPNTLPDNLKIVVKNELGIDENWKPRDGVYLIDGTGDEDDAFKMAIARDVKNGLILSEALLKEADKYASHFTLTKPSHMKLVNNHPGILVAAATLKEKTNLFQNEPSKPHDTDVWLVMDWTDGFEHIRVKHFGRNGRLPLGLKIYVNVFYPTNVFYKKLRSFLVTNPYGAKMCVPNHAMSAIIPELAIGDVWLELTYRGKDVEPDIVVLDWNPPTTLEDFDELNLTDPPAQN